MSNLCRTVLILCSGVFLNFFNGHLHAAQLDRNSRAAVLVIPEYDQDSLSSTHRAYRTAGSMIQDQLAHEFQFAVYDASARNIQLQCQQQCDGLARDQIIKGLREANAQLTHETLVPSQAEQAPIEIVVFYHILAKDIFSEIGVKRLIRISSLAIDLDSGNTIAYDDGGQQQAKFINPAEDLTNWTLSLANRHARDSAVFIGERLRAYRGSLVRPYKPVSSTEDWERRDFYFLAGIVFLLLFILLRVYLLNRKLKQALSYIKASKQKEREAKQAV